MNWKTFSAVASGVAVGYAASKYISEKTLSNPEHVLANVKKKFSTLGPIRGTWMVMKPEKFQNGVLEFDIYQGGITIGSGEESMKYEFIADAQTGSILSIDRKK